ncbi:MAG: hypothetical protein AAFU79_09325 [Myxococcota bacterium]
MKYIALMTTLSLAFTGAGCSDDDSTDLTQDSGVATDSGTTSDAGGGSPDAGGETPDAGAALATYFIATSVSTPDGDVAFYKFVDGIPSGEVSIDDAAEATVFGSFFGDAAYGITADNNLVRLRRQGAVLVEDGALGISARGTSNYLWFLSATRAFTLNRAGQEVIEFNPTEMTFTKAIDISSVRRNENGEDIRRGFIRASDNTLFIHVSYFADTPGQRVNEFAAIAVDVDSGEVSVTEDTSCPTTAGFGGFIAENDDVFMFADAFIGTANLGDPMNAKPSCVIRIPAGSRTIDPSSTLRPTLGDGTEQAFGLFGSGTDNAYVLGIDFGRIGEFGGDFFAFIGAPIHEGWVLDIRSGETEKLADLPPGGVTTDDFVVDGRLYVPRNTVVGGGGNATFDATILYEVDLDTRTTREAFSITGFLSGFQRL